MEQWFNGCHKIQEVLARFMGSAVRFELDSSKLRISYQLSVGEITGIALTTVLEAMEVIGMLDYGLAKAADLIFKHVITPAVTHASTFNAVEYSWDITEQTLKIEQSSDHKTEDVDGEAIYSGILKVVKFICSSLCFGNVTWIHSFGRFTWPRISELIISKFLSKVVPEDASKLADFQKVIERTFQFETALKELSFISPSDSEGRLSKYAENVEVHFASRKKIEILAKARSLMLQCNFTIPKVSLSSYLPHQHGLAMRNASFESGGVESLDEDSSKHMVRLLFHLKCVWCRKLLINLCIWCIRLSRHGWDNKLIFPRRICFRVYHAARDSILLYEAVVLSSSSLISLKCEARETTQWHQSGRCSSAQRLSILFEEILGLAFENLKNTGLTTDKKVLTSTVGMKDEAKGKMVQKAKASFTTLASSSHLYCAGEIRQFDSLVPPVTNGKTP
ncbi:hypothetical protein HID58_051831 [Brassica napus]|uniref:Centromere/kinetochore protein zw10 middle domain-containing protein n=1 Tax=Brassica napus TaxID=3708 RepID=A0ABQ8AAT5_BRANA|nr:hypothetical protein HID58_051831 [Brassica napus]